MTLSANTLKTIIYGLVVVLVFTTLFGFTLFMPAQEAQATGIPVVDVVSNAAKWAVHALEWLGEKALFIADKVWTFAKDELFFWWDKLHDSVKAFLTGLALKLAADFLHKIVTKLVDKNKIKDYFYYFDVLWRQIYAIRALEKRYPGNENELNKRIIITLIGTGSELAGGRDLIRNAYQGIRQQVITDPDCRTSNLSPQNPNYYTRLLQSKSPKCSPAYVFAAAQDVAFDVANDARRAAELEVRNSRGYKSVRRCGGIETEDGIPQLSLESDTDPETGLPTNVRTIERETETLPVGPNAFSLVCSAITRPGSYTYELIDEMVGVIVNHSTNPQEVTTGTQIANFLSTVTATTITKLLFEDDDGTVLEAGPDGTRLASSNNNYDYDFRGQIPDGVDANNISGSVDIPGLGNLSGRDEQQMRNFWNDFCGERLPLMFAWRNGNYLSDSTNIFAIAADGLRQKGVITPTEAPDFPVFEYLPDRAVLLDGVDASNYSKYDGEDDDTSHFEGVFRGFREGGTNRLSIEKMLTQRFGWAQDSKEVHGILINGRRFSHMVYDYIWQMHDTAHDGDQSNFDDEIALSRKYHMAKGGYPVAKDIEEASNWTPENWPYFIDSSGLGYIYAFDGEGEENEGYVRISEGKLYEADGSSTVQRDLSSAFVFETKNGELLFASEGEMWKIDKNVTVTIKDGVITTFPDSIKLTDGGSAFFVEFTKDGQTQVVAAEELSLQRPCAQEPFGPPVSLSDLETKINLSREISPPLWNWVFEESFIRDAQTGF